MHAHAGGNWRRLTERGSIGLMMVVLSVAAAPAMATAATDEDTVTLQYSFHYEASSFGEDSLDLAPTAGENVITLSCTQGECRLSHQIAYGDAEFADARFAVPGTATLTQAASGSACDLGSALRAGTGTLTFTETNVTGTLRLEPLVNFECGGNVSEARMAGTELVILESTLTTGGCYFTADGCAVDASDGTAVDTDTAENTDADASGAPLVSGSSSQIANGDAAAPSILSALATPTTAGTSPAQLGIAALLTIVLVLLIAFPTALLNSAVETGAGRLDAWRRARATRRAPVRTTAESASPLSRSWWWAGLGIVLAALISAFIDPGFGFNPGSVRVLLSILASFVIDVGLGWVLMIWLMRRANPGVTHSFVFRPVTLLVVVAAVVFCRLTGFEPGIVFGLVAGVTFGAMVGKAAEARAVLVTLGYAFGIAVVAWLLFGALGGGAVGDSVAGTFMSETLASLAIGGMAALPVALFPVRGMAGHTLWNWNRRAWAAAYAIGLFAFFIVLMPMPFAWDGVGWDLWGWIAIYLAYALGAVTLWLLVTRPWAGTSDVAGRQNDAGAEVASRLDG